MNIGGTDVEHPEIRLVFTVDPYDRMQAWLSTSALPLAVNPPNTAAPRNELARLAYQLRYEAPCRTIRSKIH